MSRETFTEAITSTEASDLSALSILGRFPSLEAAEQAVLEQAKTLIDNSSK